MDKTVRGTSLLNRTSGGGINGAKATIAEIGWQGKFTYGGTRKDKPVCALYVKFDVDGINWSPENYSAGPSENWTVIEDGDGILSTQDTEGLNSNCPAAFFIDAVVEAAKTAGIDIEDLLPEFPGGGNSIRPLEGRRVTLTRIKRLTQGGDEKEYTVIKTFETATKTTSKANGKANGKATEDEWDADEATTDAIKQVLRDADDNIIKKSELANEIMQAFKKDEHVKDMMRLAMTDRFLNTLQGVTYNRKKVTYNQKKGTLSLED